MRMVSKVLYDRVSVDGARATPGRTWKRQSAPAPDPREFQFPFRPLSCKNGIQQSNDAGDSGTEKLSKFKLCL